jgi:hypothetical protein
MARVRIAVVLYCLSMSWVPILNGFVCCLDESSGFGRTACEVDLRFLSLARAANMSAAPGATLVSTPSGPCHFCNPFPGA